MTRLRRVGPYLHRCSLASLASRRSRPKSGAAGLLGAVSLTLTAPSSPARASKLAPAAQPLLGPYRLRSRPRRRPLARASSRSRAPRGRSSAGRAPPLQGGSQEFESPRLHRPGRRRWTRRQRLRKLRGRAIAATPLTARSCHRHTDPATAARSGLRTASPRVRPNEQWCTFTTEERRHQTRVSPRNLHRYTFGEQRHSTASLVPFPMAGLDAGLGQATKGTRWMPWR